jgi:hypothetical protein
MVEVRQLGGAMGRPAPVPNAVTGRSAPWSLFVLGPMGPGLTEVVPQVGRGVLAALAPWTTPGALVNFLGDVSGPDEVLAAWEPEARERLLAVKRAVDPDDVFSGGHAFRSSGA